MCIVYVPCHYFIIINIIMIAISTAEGNKADTILLFTDHNLGIL